MSKYGFQPAKIFKTREFDIGVSIGRRPDRTGQDRTRLRLSWSKTPDREPDRNGTVRSGSAFGTRDYDMAGDDYEGPPVFDDDQHEEELMPVYDTAIEDVIEEEKGFVEKGGFSGEEDNVEDVVVVANDLCSSMIQTSISVDFSKTVDSNPMS
nr:hypothetical protein [Tanacetum cinerariifolium]